jgi:Type IV secretory pathway, VirD4 components
MILKVIFLVICWVIILFIKKGRFAEFVSDLRSSDKPKWKIWAALFYKSPWFFVTFIGNFLSLLGMIIEKHNSINLMFNSTISYMIPLAIWVWGINGPQKAKSGDKNFVRGSLIIDQAKLVGQLKNETDDNSLPITSTLKIPGNIETTHFFICGRPGAGKSQLLYRVIQKVLERNDKAIFYDFKGDFVSKFFDPEKHLLFNPFDKRSVQWNLFNDIESPLDIKSIAASLIPITGNDPYWSNAARDVFAGILIGLYHAGERTNTGIHQWCNLPAADLMEKLSRYPGTETATKHLAQEKAGQSILSIMGSYTQCFEYLKNSTGDFSIKKWASSDEDKRCVFLSNYSEISDTIRPMLSLFVELAGKRVLSLPDSSKRRFFFFIDEFGTLNHLPAIPTMLTNGRSKGMSIWIAIQDIGQIEKIYGKEIAQTIINACASSFLFAVNDPNTAEFLSRKIGDREIRELNISTSEQQFSTRGDSTTTSYQTRNERTIMPSEFLNMSNLVMLAKLSGFDLSGVQLDIIPLSDQQQAFMAREDISLSASTSGDLQVEKEIFRPPEGETLKSEGSKLKEDFLL